MEMTIKSLKIENFKGVRNFEFNPDADLTIISAKNGVGKTTIYDAFLWLLFGTNSAGEAKFDIRPKDAPYEIEPTVSAVIVVDGKETELKKVYSSKFTKDTGGFKELKTEAFINGVKKGVREYEKQIAEFVEFNYFKLLTNPRYFSEELEWQSRRELLFKLANLQGETAIASSNEKFRPLIPHLEKYGEINEYKKFLKAEDKSLTETLNKIKTRIDEVYRTIDTSINVEYEKETMLDTKEELEKLKKELNSLENNEKIEKLNLKRQKAENDMANLVVENDKFRFEQKTTKTKSIDDEINSLRLNSDKDMLKFNENKSNILQLKNNLDSLKSQKSSLAEEYKRVSAEKYDNVCPTCHRPYENGTGLAEWEETHKQKLTNIVADGNNLVVAISETTETADKIIAENEKIAENLKAIADKIKALEEKKSAIVIDNIPDFEKKASKIKAEIDNAIAEIDKVNSTKANEINALKGKIEILTMDIENSEKRLAVATANHNAEMRIEELREEQREIANKKAKIQQNTDLVKDFILAKISITEKEINNKFRFVKFKLFNQNVTNDDINECCEAIAFNSPSYKNLSYSQKIIVGLDIISAFSKAFKLNIPIFFDNLDSLDTDNKKMIFDMVKSQKIALVVSDKPALTIEQ